MQDTQALAVRIFAAISPRLDGYNFWAIRRAHFCDLAGTIQALEFYDAWLTCKTALEATGASGEDWADKASAREWRDAFTLLDDSMRAEEMPAWLWEMGR